MASKSTLSYPSLITPTTTLESLRLRLSMPDAVGIDIDGPNAQGQTALMVACLKNNVPVAQYIYSQGANVARVCQSGRNVLFHVVSRTHNHHLLAMLMSHPRKVATQSAAILKSEHPNDRWTLKRLIDENVLDLDNTDLNGSSPVHVASEANWFHAVNVLLDAGATILNTYETSPVEAVFRRVAEAESRALTPRSQMIQFEKWILTQRTNAPAKRERTKTAAQTELTKIQKAMNSSTGAGAEEKKQSQDEIDDLFDLFGDRDDEKPSKPKSVAPTAIQSDGGGSAATTTPTPPAAPTTPTITPPTPVLTPVPTTSTLTTNEVKKLENKDTSPSASAALSSTASALATAASSSSSSTPTPSSSAAAAAAAAAATVSAEMVNMDPKYPAVVGEPDWIPVLEDWGSVQSRYNSEYLWNLLKRLVALEKDDICRLLLRARRPRVVDLIISRIGIDNVLATIEQYHRTNHDEKTWMTSALLAVLSYYLYRRPVPFQMSDYLFEICLNSMIDEGESIIRPFALALLRPMNRQYITVSRVNIIFDCLLKTSSIIMYRYQDWEQSIRFFESFFPVALKMLILSHRPPGPGPRAAPSESSTSSLPAVDVDTKRPPAAAGAAIISESKDNINVSNSSNININYDDDVKKHVGLPGASESTLIPYPFPIKGGGDTSDTKHEHAMERRIQRQQRRQARQLKRLKDRYPTEPEETCVPAPIPLLPYRHQFDELWRSLQYSLRVVTSRFVDVNDCRRLGLLLHAFYGWHQVMGSDELIAHPLTSTIGTKDDMLLVEPVDPFDLLQRSFDSKMNAIFSMHQIDSNSADEKTMKEGKQNDVKPANTSSSSTAINDADEVATSDEDKNQEIPNDGRSGDEWSGEDDQGRRERLHRTLWHTRPSPAKTKVSASQPILTPQNALLGSLLPVINDDVLSPYLQLPASDAVSGVLIAHQTAINYITLRLRSYQSSFMAFTSSVIKPELDTLEKKSNYLVNVIENRVKATATWKVEIDRLGDAKEITPDSKPPPTEVKNLGNTEIKVSKPDVADNKLVPTQIVEDVVRQLMDVVSLKGNERLIFSKMRAKFTGEPGSGDGPTREIFGIISKEFFGSTSPFFAPSPDGSCLHIRAESSRIPNYVRYFEAIGRFLAICLKDKQLPAVTLSRAIIKSILSREVNWHDLEKFDRPTYMTFKSFMDEGKKVDQTFPQYFVYSSDDGLHDIPLCVGGATLQLDDINKERFVNLYSNERLIESNLPQLIALVKGFRHLYFKQELAPISVDDLSSLLSGPLTIDLDEWQKHVRYGNSTHKKLPQAKWFWQVVTEMNDDEKRKLLTFWCGTPHAPLFGFAETEDDRWNLNISTNPAKAGSLPEASTCSFEIRLPMYRSLEETRLKIHAAINLGCVGYTSG